MLRECGDDDAGARLGADLPILFLTETRQPGSGNRVPSGSLSMPQVRASSAVDAHHHYQRDFRIGQHHYSTFRYRSLKRKASRDVHSARGHKFTVGKQREKVPNRGRSGDSVYSPRFRGGAVLSRLRW